MNDEYDPNYIPKKSFALVGQKAIITNPDNKILVLQRSNESGSGSKWSLPGGALEHGESPTEAIKREIKEETTLLVKDVTPFHTISYLNSDGDFVVIVGYSCVIKSGEVNLNWEHNTFKWLYIKDALALDLTEDGKTLINEFDVATEKVIVKKK